ncbi:hypothetical protein BV22DRAFT_1044871 [Leucogyrophana mollusca]|uniref:Uncharacterized protein n=1 Tax=Leucogyrophana mollusca TaxID=85980 RepID=A0ACB8BRA5_9AGAM|nr:hypothetical protein BV22DRAFT_1044871 [Leucogyrophana mollusca]
MTESVRVDTEYVDQLQPPDHSSRCVSDCASSLLISPREGFARASLRDAPSYNLRELEDPVGKMSIANIDVVKSPMGSVTTIETIFTTIETVFTPEVPVPTTETVSVSGGLVFTIGTVTSEGPVSTLFAVAPVVSSQPTQSSPNAQ